MSAPFCSRAEIYKGRAFAEALAKRGLNVVILSRTREKLEAVADHLQNTYKVQCRVIPMDFSTATSQHYEQIENQLKDLTVGVLINNLGGTVGSSAFKRFLDIPWEIEEATRKMNIESTMRMTRIFLPPMISRKKGVILNIGSLASRFGQFLIPYSSSKAKLNSFTESLAAEYAHEGVAIQCMLGGKISTPAMKNPPVSIDVPSAERFAEDCIYHLGYGESVVVPYWFHAFQVWSVTLLPVTLRNYLLARIYSNVAQSLT